MIPEKSKIEKAKQAIAQYCGTTIERSRINTSFCSFTGFLFSVTLLSRPRKTGFHFYSDATLEDETSVMGPWMQNILQANGFSANECQVRTNRSPDSEGHVADFYLDIDWENLSQDDLEKIKNLYDRLIVFQNNVWPADEAERMQSIREYNENHLDAVRLYIHNRRHEQLEVSDEIHADESSQIETNEGSFMINEIKNLLEYNLNVILTGAPGTGKTYMAKAVAKELAGDESRIDSVQFHPGYDYSDFVVGMKPVLVSAEGLCVFRDKNGLFTRKDDKDDGERQSFSGNTTVSFRWLDGVFKTFADKAKKTYDDAPDKDNAPKFVFLIDEINRADLSRVFGELFSLLEDEYRYPNDKGTDITLPNGEHFVIPRNLYILGTMNDIDRSVESMDFALRRRFAWKEVKAGDTCDAILDSVDKDGHRKIVEAAAAKLKTAMNELNREIGGEEGAKLDLRLGTAYQLGGAIFAKFEKYAGNDNSFENLWNNHIENTLSEYLRGRREAGRLLSSLKTAYETAVGKTSQGDSTQDSQSTIPETPRVVPPAQP